MTESQPLPPLALIAFNSLQELFERRANDLASLTMASKPDGDGWRVNLPAGAFQRDVPDPPAESPPV